jgi:hypothetical protein
MATGTGDNTGTAAIPTASRCADGPPVAECADARGEAGSMARSMAGSEVGAGRPFIEVSDKDYRSFCFPCHALEEATNCNAGY